MVYAMGQGCKYLTLKKNVITATAITGKSIDQRILT